MREKLNTLPLAQLREIAKANGLKGISGLKKADLIDRLMVMAEEQKQSEEAAAKAKKEPAKEVEQSRKTGGKTASHSGKKAADKNSQGKKKTKKEKPDAEKTEEVQAPEETAPQEKPEETKPQPESKPAEEAQRTGNPVEILCAIGDESVVIQSGSEEFVKPFEEIVHEVKGDIMINHGGFERFAEWGYF